uniref:Uncharacterized protein LOC104219426 n=1 Tax=Nicotiana sylvestris TaxID=4096 RepID=A0A1U7W1B0_NICSY|nr:PREDICTED: uncharacterized protein LOC104219426 [Nicotiana sylvestris]
MEDESVRFEAKKQKQSDKSAQTVPRPKVKDNAGYKKFLDILKQMQINIPLVDILQKVPKCAKYIKDIVENKRKLAEFETVALTEECSSRIQSKLPQKLKDPDRSLDSPKGMIEDVLDYGPDQEVPFILRSLFLATSRAIIDVCEEKMTMRVGDQVDAFTVYKALTFPLHYEELSMISVVEGDVTSVVPYMSLVDPLK